METRLAHGDPCEPFGEPGEGATAAERSDYLCVDTLVPVWAEQLGERPGEAAAVSGHEAVHRWQRELGCTESVPNWLHEVNATDFAWRALVYACATDEAATMRAICRFGGFGDGVGPLRRYETESGGDPEYALWHFAVRELLRDAAGGPVAMRRFCEAVAAGTSWRAAFEQAFGRSAEQFYPEFEVTRTSVRSPAATGRHAPNSKP